MAETKSDLSDVFERLFLLGVGAFSLTKDKVESVVNDLVARGKISKEEGRDLVSQIRARGKSEKDAISKYVTDAVSKAIDRSDFATKRDTAKLEAEIADLKKQLAAAKRPARKPAAPKTKK